MNTLFFWTEIRNNNIIRSVCIPILRIKRKRDFKKYQSSEDYKYIKTLKNICNGERCFIIGNGPSLTREDLDLLVSEKTFAFNRIYQMYPYTDWRPTYYMAMDGSILQKLRQEKKSAFEAEYLFLADRKLVKRYKKQNAFQVIKQGNTAVRRERNMLTNVYEDVYNHFSPAQSVTINALEFAFYMGFKEIYLLGLDHSFAVEVDINGKKHINKDVQNHFKEDNDKAPYANHKEALTKEYEICKKYADEHGIKVVNVTRGGKLEVFERDTLENILAK